MKKYDYYRPVARPPVRRKKVRKNILPSLIKHLIVCCVLAGLCWGGYVLAVRLYKGISASRLGQWKPKAVDLSGVDGPIAKEILAVMEPKVGTPFAVKDAVALQNEFLAKYPQLRKVSVKRGLLSGKVHVKAQRREPIAKFFLSGQAERFIDKDGTVYTDTSANPTETVQTVELVGKIPLKLDKEIVALLESILKLKKQLDFALLHIDLAQNTVTLTLPDQSIIYLGAAQDLREKVRRAAEIESAVTEQQPRPHVLDFTYFKEGKVFLRQKSL